MVVTIHIFSFFCSSVGKVSFILELFASKIFKNISVDISIVDTILNEYSVAVTSEIKDEALAFSVSKRGDSLVDFRS